LCRPRTGSLMVPAKGARKWDEPIKMAPLETKWSRAAELRKTFRRLIGEQLPPPAVRIDRSNPAELPNRPSQWRANDQNPVRGGQSSGSLVEDQEKFDRNAARILQ
jgi:hypothetical protein